MSPRDPQLDRDEVWCQALLSSGLKIDQVAVVLKRFNELRPDQAGGGIVPQPQTQSEQTKKE